MAAIRIRRSSRALNGFETRRAGRQQAKKKINAPRPRAIAPYWTPRATESALFVMRPVPPPASSWSSDCAGAAASPTVNTKPLETGCPSAETTR